MLKLDPKTIKQHETKLLAIATQLKSEFYGIDSTIDKVINSVKAWYIFPQLIKRPVIICLWGLTGVGKTELVRRLVKLLDFQHKFVEIQMDGVTSSNANHERTIGGILSESSIEEGEPGILLLDEFQRYKTKTLEGDIKVERFQDVWMLLSDGKFSANTALFKELEMMLAFQSYDKEDREEDEGSERRSKRKKKRKFLVYPYEAQSLKKRLKLNESIMEIMQWDATIIAQKIQECKDQRAGLEVDYSKLLVFVSGNLDEAYPMALAVDDCDTDADVYYELSKQVSVTDIKAALNTRFKPEQIARFGNNHIIYTSLSKATYEKLIQVTCQKYLEEMGDITGITFTLSDNARNVIYDNAVYPSQGTRPVFSSVHKILSDGLVQLSFWAVKNKIEHIDVDIDATKCLLVGVGGKKQHEVPVDLDLTHQRGKSTKDFNTLVAVHEAGHALLYALLKGTAPKEVKINTISFKGGYTITSLDVTVSSKMSIKDDLAILYGGLAAEELIFKENRSSGSANDLGKATALAARYVREFAMDKFPGVVTSSKALNEDLRISFLTNVNNTNKAIALLLEEQHNRAKDLLEKNSKSLEKLTSRLLHGDSLQQDDFIALLPELKLQREEKGFGYADDWADFIKK